METIVAKIKKYNTVHDKPRRGESIIKLKVIQSNKNFFTCPCCGYKTLKEQPPGTYEICDVCGWEDDAVDPDYEGGANGGSLRMYQRDFYKVEDSKKLTLENLVKQGKYWYEFDENWKPLDE